MRWEKKVKPQPKSGDIRWKKRFALFPKEIWIYGTNTVTIWWEHYYVQEIYYESRRSAGGWSEFYFLENAPEVIEMKSQEAVKNSLLGKALRDE